MNYNQKEVVSTLSNYVSIIFSLAFLLLSSLNISAQCNRRNDSLELVKLYNATDGPNWKKNSNWLVPGKTIDTWQGLRFDFNGCLTSIDLNFNNLKGKIYSFNFPNIAFLGLSDNNLSGSIPNFDKMANLTQIWLYSNQLTGSVPNFDKLPKLTELLFSRNLWTGTIPNFNRLQLLLSL